MYLIGGRGQPIRTSDGVIHLITQHDRGGFSSRTACGIIWRKEDGVAFIEPIKDVEVSCMTCMVHEARS